MCPRRTVGSTRSPVGSGLLDLFDEACTLNHAQVTADAVEQKGVFDKLFCDNAAQKAQLDKVRGLQLGTTLHMLQHALGTQARHAWCMKATKAYGGPVSFLAQATADAVHNKMAYDDLAEDSIAQKSQLDKVSCLSE